MTPPLTERDLHLFSEGAHGRLFEHLGAHPRFDLAHPGRPAGTSFAVWAPGADDVSVVGDFNAWQPGTTPLRPRASSGIWEGHVDEVGPGALYKYHIVNRAADFAADKTDPLGFSFEVAPKTAAVVTSLDYEWGDASWMTSRSEHNGRDCPQSIYEVHLGSWRRVPEEGYRSLSYREVAEPLIEHVLRHGFTHVELLPVMEHPFFGSWGYQTTGYFAPSSRYGSPQDFMFLVDRLHQAGIGIILDWVPSHFPADEFALASFDGTHLYEHADPRRGFHPDWGTLIFNYGRHEVRSFLLSSAMFWLGVYHADGLRVDAVASMLYRDYSRLEGEWVPNEFGGREDLEAVAFLRRLNEDVYREHPDVQTFAEESTAWEGVSRPTDLGGLGFGFKWDMGWMHDTLQFFSRDPIHRSHHQGELTFRSVYAFSESFVLPLSHDEVVHGKRSLLEKMPGDDWQRHANHRLLLGYMYAQPGKKLLFMGAEMAQPYEWNHDGSMAWEVTTLPGHAGVSAWLRDLNALYRSQPALHVHDLDPKGFEWGHTDDPLSGILSFWRHGDHPDDRILVVCNYTPVARERYRVGVSSGGRWIELLNGDAACYGGSGQDNPEGASAEAVPTHGRPLSIALRIPPLACLFLKRA